MLHRSRLCSVDELNAGCVRLQLPVWSGLCCRHQIVAFRCTLVEHRQSADYGVSGCHWIDGACFHVDGPIFGHSRFDRLVLMVLAAPMLRQA